MYLFVIARSTAADIRKRPSSRPLAPVEEDRVPSQPDSVDQILDSLIVREAFETLGEGHARVLQLAQEEGLTQSQIAERLGLPLGTAKTRTFHGIRALRAVLAERVSMACDIQHALEHALASLASDSNVACAALTEISSADEPFAA